LRWSNGNPSFDLGSAAFGASASGEVKLELRPGSQKVYINGALALTATHTGLDAYALEYLTVTTFTDEAGAGWHLDNLRAYDDREYGSGPDAAVATPSGPSFSDMVLALNPSLYWKLNEASGAVVQDSSTNNRDGTIGAGATFPGATPTQVLPGLVGDGGSLDLSAGANSHASSDATFTSSNVTTFVAFKADALPSASLAYVVIRGDTIPLPGAHDKGIYLQALSGSFPGALVAYAWDGTTRVAQSGNDLVQVGVWNIAAIRTNGSTLDLFFNGRVVASVPCGASYSGATKFALGAAPTGSVSLDGQVARAVQFESALTDAQIIGLMQAAMRQFGGVARERLALA